MLEQKLMLLVLKLPEQGLPLLVFLAQALPAVPELELKLLPVEARSPKQILLAELAVLVVPAERTELVAQVALVAVLVARYFARVQQVLAHAVELPVALVPQWQTVEEQPRAQTVAPP